MNVHYIEHGTCHVFVLDLMYLWNLSTLGNLRKSHERKMWLFSRSSGIMPKTSRPARVLSVTSGLVSLLRKRFLVFLSGGIWYPRQNFLITARQASWHTPRPLTGKSLSNTSGLAGSSSKMVSVPNGYSRNLVRNDAKLNLFSKCKKTLKVKVP